METLKFKLDKAHQIYFECGKKKGTTFALVVIFFALAALAIFSENIGNKITVPVLHLKLNKLDAEVVFLLAGAVSFYRYSCFSYLLRLLRIKFYCLLREANSDDVGSIWYLSYPSVEQFLSHSHKFDPKVAVIGNLVKIFFFLGSISFSIFLSFKIGQENNYSIFWWVSFIPIVFLTIASMIILIKVPPLDMNRPKEEELIQKIDNRVAAKSLLLVRGKPGKNNNIEK